MAQTQVIFLILGGLIILSSGAMYLLAPSSMVEYTAIDVELHKTNYRKVGKTSFDFNNPNEISNFPTRIGKWYGIGFRYSEKVYETLDADIVLSRAYSNSETGSLIWMDIINSDKRKSFHNPEICYGGGWNIVESYVDEVKVNTSKELVFDKIQVNVLHMHSKSDPEEKLTVIYWFMLRSGGGITMLRLTTPVEHSYEYSAQVGKEFTKDVISVIYEDIKTQQTVAEKIIDNYGYAGYAGILSVAVAGFIPIIIGIRERNKE